MNGVVSAAEAPAASARGRVLVTGASGFVGSHAAEHLAQDGWQVRCLVRETSSRRWLESLVARGAELAVGEVAQGRGLAAACAGCDSVVHAAGITNALHPDEYAFVNTQGTLRLWMAAEAAGVRRFLLVSSMAAGGPSPPGTSRDESVPPRPINAYGRSKLDAERVVLESGGPMEPLIVRPPAVYGPRDEDVLTLVRAAKLGWFPKTGGGRRELSLVHAADLAEGIRLTLERGAARGVYYITDGVVHSLAEVGEAMARALGRRVRTLPLPWPVLWAGALVGELTGTVLRRPAVLNLDRVRQFVLGGWTASDARARNDLGYVSRYDLVGGMEDTVRWYRNAGWI